TLHRSRGGRRYGQREEVRRDVDLAEERHDSRLEAATRCDGDTVGRRSLRGRGAGRGDGGRGHRGRRRVAGPRLASLRGSAARAERDDLREEATPEQEHLHRGRARDYQPLGDPGYAPADEGATNRPWHPPRYGLQPRRVQGHRSGQGPEVPEDVW